MNKIFGILLVILTMQLCFDETLSHFDFKGNIDLKGNSSFASVNFQLQKCHDHFWVVSAFSGLITCREKSDSPVIVLVHCTLPDYTLSIWQPPKISQI